MVIYDPDRLARDLGVQLAATEMITHHRVHLEFCTHPRKACSFTNAGAPFPSLSAPRSGRCQEVIDQFLEQTWTEYFDFEPFLRSSLKDLLQSD